jgi:hypothetical protein
MNFIGIFPSLLGLGFCSTLLLFGQEVQPPQDAQPREALATPAGAILKDGTPIKLRLVNKLDSRVSKDEDAIAFDIVNDVVLGGVTILRRGDPASGVVVQSVSSKRMGRAGRLNFEVSDIKLRDSSAIKVRAFNKESGEGRTAEIIADMLVAPMVAAPFFLLIRGEDTTFPRGTEINTFVNGDRRLDLSAFGAGPTK